MSRADAVGMFWQDFAPVKEGMGRIESRHRAIPPIPEGGWLPPSEFPRLGAAAAIAIDCETWDPDLLTRGPGWVPGGRGHIIGISVGVPDGGRWYFPMRHEIGGDLNLPPDQVLAWARDALAGSQPKVGANLAYDLGWLAHEGVVVGGPLIDVQIAEPLIDEYRRSYSLQSLGQKYLNEGKVTTELEDWAMRAYGNKNFRAELYRCPPVLVGPYAEGDCDLPLRIWEQQRAALEEQDLMSLFEMEAKLPRLLNRMRMRGVRVDIAKAKSMDDELTQRLESAQRALNTVAGIPVDVDTKDHLVRLFDRAGVELPRTAKGAPSVTRGWLEHNSHPACQAIMEVRRFTKYRDVFVRSYILENHRDGRIHAAFNQLRSDDFGTVSGRFSSSGPNLQNIPARDEEWGPRIRSLFLPDEGELWTSLDWSQIEYRFLVHNAIGNTGEDARAAYRNDPTTDFHKMVQDMTGLPRKAAKNVNFGLVYGMGEDTLADNLGMSVEDARREVFDVYHAKVPFVRETFWKASERATTRGFVKTIMGRRARFDLWVKQGSYGADAEAIVGRDAAIAKWGKRIKRVGTHKALNRVLQGSSADLMKKAMVECDEAGLFDVLGAPLLTVHDELDNSQPQTAEGREATAEVKRIMETSMILKVPVLVDLEVGLNWGDAK